MVAIVVEVLVVGVLAIPDFACSLVYCEPSREERLAPVGEQLPMLSN